MDTSWPATTTQVMAFVAHLSLNGKASSTIAVRVSAISYIHNMYGWIDPTRHFLIRKMLEGCRRGHKSKDARRPITWEILNRIIPNLRYVCASNYEACLFQAAFLLAFHGFLRVSEFAAERKNSPIGRVLARDDVVIEESNPRHIVVRIRYSKTDQYGDTTLISLKENGLPNACPIRAMVAFRAVRTNQPGALFCHANGSPLTRYQVSAVLKKVLVASGIPSAEYGTHSFRIGAATTAALNGVPVEKIKEMGRWRSDAYKCYIRP